MRLIRCLTRTSICHLKSSVGLFSRNLRISFQLYLVLWLDWFFLNLWHLGFPDNFSIKLDNLLRVFGRFECILCLQELVCSILIWCMVAIKLRWLISLKIRYFSLIQFWHLVLLSFISINLILDLKTRSIWLLNRLSMNRLRGYWRWNGTWIGFVIWAIALYLDRVPFGCWRLHILDGRLYLVWSDNLLNEFHEFNLGLAHMILHLFLHFASDKQSDTIVNHLFYESQKAARHGRLHEFWRLERFSVARVASQVQRINSYRIFIAAPVMIPMIVPRTVFPPGVTVWVRVPFRTVWPFQTRHAPASQLLQHFIQKRLLPTLWI